MIGQSPGHHGDDRAAAGRRRGPRRGQEADGGEDVADRGDPVRGVLAPLPHILHTSVLRAKYVISIIQLYTVPCLVLNYLSPAT